MYATTFQLYHYIQIRKKTDKIQHEFCSIQRIDDCGEIISLPLFILLNICTGIQIFILQMI